MIMKIKHKWEKLELNKKFTFIIINFLMIPFLAFSLLLFHMMENNTISEKLYNMENSMKEDYDQIVKNVNSINMATQFILSDQSLIDYLKIVKSNEQLSIEETIDFYKLNVSFLERMVNNNPYLYQLRVYVDSETMQEMMPILYRKKRMERLKWSKDDILEGWKFDYEDTLFDSFVIGQDNKVMSLVTPIYDYSSGLIGIIEVAMSMNTMFPSLYEETSNEWNYFVDNKNNIYWGGNKDTELLDYINQVGEHVNQAKKVNLSDTYYTKINGKPMVVGYLHVKEISGTLVSIQSAEDEIEKIYFLRNVTILIMFLVLFLLIAIINAVVKKLLKQLYLILGHMREVGKGDLSIVIDVKGQDEMGELGHQFNRMLYKIRRLMEENIQRELIAKNSEIKALQNQINAHFIYNVLESIKMMAEINEEYEISDSVTILGKLLRYSMKWNSKTVTVREEIEYIKNYLVLINLRFDYEIYLSTKISDLVLEQHIPKMSLQPIVENAINHGVEQLAKDTTIYIKGFANKQDCIIEITDAGKGMTKEEVNNLYRKLEGEIEVSGGSGNGIGLKNVHDRIKMSFGQGYGIEIFSKVGCYTKIQVRIPLTVKGED